MRFIRSEVDTCMYFRWNTLRLLVVSILWIGGDICFRRKDEVKKIKRKIKIMFDCDDVGGLKLYGGCNVDNDLVIFKFTQPLILQSLRTNFIFPRENLLTHQERQDSHSAEWQVKTHLFLRIA